VDQWHHLIALILQREMAGVDQVKLDIGKVALVGIGAVGRDNLVVFAPDDQRRRLVFAEIGLHGRIKR